MLSDLAKAVLLAKAATLGRDGAGNYIVSTESMQELATVVAVEVAKAAQHPVITTTFDDVLELACLAGFQPHLIQANGARTTIITDPQGRVDVTQQASALIDHTTRLVLRRVREFIESTQSET